MVYGSLAAVIILMLWFYMTGLTILFGGEVNAIIEQAAAGTGDPEAKAPREKHTDERAKVRSTGAQSTQDLEVFTANAITGLKPSFGSKVLL